MGKRRNVAHDTSPSEPLQIPEDEQWRIIKESGILKKAGGSKREDTPEERVLLIEELSDCLLYLTPFSFLLLLMDIMIHNQYGRTLTLQDILDRMVPGVPILAIFIFYTMRHKRDRRMQFLLFMLANIAGPRLLWLLSLGPWKVNINQCPPLITLWVYTIVQLDLGPAALNLLITGIYVLLRGLKPLL